MCSTANRFAPLALNTEEHNNNCDSIVENDQHSGKNVLKSTKHSTKVCKGSKQLEKNHSIDIVHDEFQDGQKEGQKCQNRQDCALILLKTNML